MYLVVTAALVDSFHHVVHHWSDLYRYVCHDRDPDLDRAHYPYHDPCLYPYRVNANDHFDVAALPS